MGEKLKLPAGCSLSLFFSLSSSLCDADPFSAGSRLSLSHSETTCSINTHCRQNHGNLTGQRACENKCSSVCLSVCVCLCASPCTYMQPEQSLLLYRCWISRKPAANESKHFLHGEGQRAQLDIKHLTVGQMFQWFVIQPAINEPVTYVIFNAS